MGNHHSKTMLLNGMVDFLLLLPWLVRNDYLSHLTYPQFKHLLFTRNALHCGQFTGL
jgi:hypothetical protein